MTKIIQNPDRIINAFVSSFGEDNRDLIEQAFSRYISDAVIAVTAEDIIEQVIAWANSQENFHAAWIEPEDEDRDRFNFITGFLEAKLNITEVMSEIERKGNLSDVPNSISVWRLGIVWRLHVHRCRACCAASLMVLGLVGCRRGVPLALPSGLG